jgi:hypothetical protein
MPTRSRWRRSGSTTGVDAMNDARLWHPWLRINRVLRAMLHEHWSAEAGEGTEDVRKGWTVTTPPRFECRLFSRKRPQG